MMDNDSEGAARPGGANTSIPGSTAEPVTWTGFGREMGLIVLVGGAVWLFFAYVIHPMIGWPALAPVPARTLVIVAVVWWLLRRRGEGFAALGLCKPKIVWLAGILGFAFLLADLLLFGPLFDGLRQGLGVPPSDISLFTPLYGNLPLYLMWITIAWAAGGFGEEILFRGYLMNRFAVLFGGQRLGWTLAVLLQGALFGLMHAYQGFGGVLVIGLSAMVSGVYYLVAGRNLWPLIFLHGAWDTLGITLIYLKGVPEL
jgi:membrane protease YdiL (CAAX protease family)